VRSMVQTLATKVKILFEEMEAHAPKTVGGVYETVSIEVKLSRHDLVNVRRILDDDRFEPDEDAILVVKVRRK
jgi:hypothetical protein